MKKGRRGNQGVLGTGFSSVGPSPGAELMLCNEQGGMDDYRNSYEEISIPAGLSHRLKPARCAALAVEKVTAGRLLVWKQGG